MDVQVLVAIIGGTTAIAAGIVTGIFKLIEFRKKKKAEDEAMEPLTQLGLFEKDLFNKADYWTKYTIKRLGFEQGEKNWIFENIMRIKIEVVTQKAKEFIENNDLITLSDIKFENSVFNMLSQVDTEYNNKVRSEFTQKFGKSKGEKVFDMVMDKQPSEENPSMGFNVWHSSIITYMEKSIKDHCDAHYLNNIEKMDLILDEIKCALATSYTHLYKMFANFNGDLDYILMK